METNDRISKGNMKEVFESGAMEAGQRYAVLTRRADVPMSEIEEGGKLGSKFSCPLCSTDTLHIQEVRSDGVIARSSTDRGFVHMNDMNRLEIELKV